MKRSQAALEFLMTYGWAILGVMAAIGALAYFGVFNPNRVLPQRCEFSGDMYCVGSTISDGQVVVALKHRLDKSIKEVSADLTYNNVLYRCRTPTDWSVDTVMNISCGVGTIRFDKYAKFKMNVTFTKRDSTYRSVSLGSIQGPVDFCMKKRVPFNSGGASDLNDVACCDTDQNTVCAYNGNCYADASCIPDAPWSPGNPYSCKSNNPKKWLPNC